MHDDDGEVGTIGAIHLGQPGHAFPRHRATLDQPGIVKATGRCQRTAHLGQVPARFHDDQRICGLHVGDQIILGQGGRPLRPAMTWKDTRAEAAAARLRERNIIVRHFRQPRIDQHLRISIGTDAECRALVEALRAIVAG